MEGPSARYQSKKMVGRNCPRKEKVLLPWLLRARCKGAGAKRLDLVDTHVTGQDRKQKRVRSLPLLASAVSITLNDDSNIL